MLTGAAGRNTPMRRSDRARGRGLARLENHVASSDRDEFAFSATCFSNRSGHDNLVTPTLFGLVQRLVSARQQRRQAFTMTIRRNATGNGELN